ncbi:unnamed protein product [Thlaspi arvense]|uniref:Methenyltetrahydrofolate cyclohydrolase n=1 Tax=Thlaspi arvense TaxID=13288 RepID=A0AAU9SG90_THLAR|nr:unnamed protein product [Thlaspi arvense]
MGAFLPRRCVGQLCLRTTDSGRGCTLSIRSSSGAAMVIDQPAVSLEISLEVGRQVSRMKKSIGAVPGLAVIHVGEKKRYDNDYDFTCSLVGIKAFPVRLAEDSSEEEVLNCVSRFNDDPRVHGILLHFPLPWHMDEHKVLSAVSIEKDVDGFHPVNIGRLAMRGREPLFVPRAPKGCIELLHRYNLEIKGKRAVVIGRDHTFDMPAALLLQREDATVTIIDSTTKNPEEITRQADILISAIGQANMVRGSWIKPGAVIINVGTSLLKDPDALHGYRVVGDICYEEVCKVASAIKPVAAGGVGTITLSLLLSNTLTSAKRFHNFI